MISPLHGKRIVVTRSADQSAGVRAKLTALGAVPVLFPTIQFVPLSSPELEDALSQIDGYDWLILTSANAVKFFWRHLLDRGVTDELPAIAVSGPVTADALTKHSGNEPVMVPERYVASELVDGLGTLEGKRVLLPRSRIGGEDLVQMLEDGGAFVDDIALYDTVAATPSEKALEQLRSGFDAVTFASPSSVRNFLTIMDRHEISQSVIEDSVIACVGPVTATAVENAGLRVHVVAEPHTMDGLIVCLLKYYASDLGQ